MTNYEAIQQKKTAEIRKQLIGHAIIECCKAGEEIHIRLEQDDRLPPSAGPFYQQQTPEQQRPMGPQEKFTMSKEEFRAMMKDEIKKHNDLERQYKNEVGPI